MDGENRPRFRTTQDALRFFFRVHHALHEGGSWRPPPGLPVDAEETGWGALGGYLSIGWCMRGLDEVEIFLLSQIYGPGWFGALPARAAENRIGADRVRPPRSNSFEPEQRAKRSHKLERGAHRAAEMHRGALAVVRRGLAGLGIIPGAAGPPEDGDSLPAELVRRPDFPVRLELAETPAKRIVQGR